MTALGIFLVAVVVYIIKQLFYSLSSYMSDSRLAATHLVGYQLIYDSSSYSNVVCVASWTFKFINNGPFVLFRCWIFNEVKGPASVVCQLMIIWHCDFKKECYFADKAVR